MEELLISERLKAIVQFIPKGKKVADIGSDHALLPSFLIQEGIAPFVIAGEVNEGPFRTAKRQIESSNMDKFVSVRKGNGLTVINENEVDVITIAGMGGALIAQILEEGKTKLLNIERLILQPNVGEEIVRQWLDQNNWGIIDETILEENDKIYEIIVAEPQKDHHREKVQNQDQDQDQDQDQVQDQSCYFNKADLLRLGPILWAKKPPLLLKKWIKEEKKIQYILNQIKLSKLDQAEKRKELENQKLWLKRVIKCLQKDSG